MLGYIRVSCADAGATMIILPTARPMVTSPSIIIVYGPKGPIEFVIRIAEMHRSLSIKASPLGLQERYMAGILQRINHQ